MSDFHRCNVNRFSKARKFNKWQLQHDLIARSQEDVRIGQVVEIRPRLVVFRAVKHWYHMHTAYEPLRVNEDESLRLFIYLTALPIGGRSPRCSVEYMHES